MNNPERGEMLNDATLKEVVKIEQCLDYSVTEFTLVLK
jgi:hypothetical protein